MRRRKISPLLRRAVFERADGCCEFCKHPFAFAPGPFHVDHFVPLFRLGSQTLANLVLACDGWNALKWTHLEWPDPQTRQKVPLFNPRIQIWSEHFRWSEDLTTVHGLSPEGRATADLLQLNRSGLVNSRRALLAVGAHPGLTN